MAKPGGNDGEPMWLDFEAAGHDDARVAVGDLLHAQGDVVVFMAADDQRQSGNFPGQVLILFNRLVGQRHNRRRRPLKPTLRIP